jgi:aminopeptidase-like protein
MSMADGGEMHEFIAALYPICRSITGNGVRTTLEQIKRYIPLTVHEVPSVYFARTPAMGSLSYLILQRKLGLLSES